MLLFIGFCLSNSGRLFDRFPEVEGNLIVHPFPDRIDSLSGQEIFELQDENGLTVWFKRHIKKDVCTTGECKMIDLWLYWDGVGNYHSMEIPENEPLTKTDHTVFDASDYKKLEDILQDTSSVLKDMGIEDLTEEEPEDLDEVDGYTGATLLSLEQIVVRDAVYTCHSLWHTVYGPTQVAIREILDRRISHKYLSMLFESGNPSYLSWAIQSIRKHTEYHSPFFPMIISLILSDHQFLSEQALDYFQPGNLKDEAVQERLVEILPEVGPNKQNKLIWKLSELEKTHDDVVFSLLDLYEREQIGVGSLNMIYRLVQPRHLDHPRVLPVLNRLKTHENDYIKNLTGRLLKENS